MPLTGAQNQLLRDAILNGFSASNLEELMLFEMDVRLPQVIPGGPLASVAFNLISWCDAQGRIPELLTAIARGRPMNVSVQKAVADLRAALGLGAPASGAAPAGPQPDAPPAVTPENIGPLLAQVRQTLLALYPDLEELVILFEDTLGARFESVAGGGKSTAQVHEVVKWANANRAFRLCPLLAAVAAQHPNSEELARLRRQFCPA